MKVLFLTHRLPYPPNRGDRIRAWHLLGALQEFAETHVVALAHDREEIELAAQVTTRASGITLAPVPWLRSRVRAAVGLAGRQPLTHALLDSPGLHVRLEALVTKWRPDVVLAYCSGMARYALEPPLAGLPLVLDMVDVDSLKWQALGRRGAPPLRWIHAREAVRLRAFEKKASLAAAATLVVSHREANALALIAPGAAIHTVGNGVDLGKYAPPGAPSASTTVVYTGVFDYAPNEDGALWFGRKVWPLVRQRHPDARFLVVGASPTARLRRMAAADPSIVITGPVPEVTPYLWQSALSVAPIHIARGTQNKVIEATAAGLPSVVTPEVHEGLPDAIRPACLVAPDTSTFAMSVGELLDLPAPERRARALRASLHELTWERTLAPLRDILVRAVEHRAPRDMTREPAHVPA